MRGSVGHKGARVAFDPINLESKFRPGLVMVVDGRSENARYLRRNLQRHYRYRSEPGRHIFELLEQATEPS